jgi:twitching motility protein PilT
MAKIDKLLEQMAKTQASDLHIAVGQPPKFRIHGDLGPITDKPLTKDVLEPYLFEILNEQQLARFQRDHDLDFAYGLEGVARFRVNYYMQQHGIGGAFRLIPSVVWTLEEAGAPAAAEYFCQLRAGLVLVTGPTGSGKSTTLAAMIDYINERYDKHILTVEDPIEFVHENKKCLITQREVYADTDSFANALKSSMRQDPDVVLVGEMRDLETIGLAVTLAEMGMLVFATLHTNRSSPSSSPARIRAWRRWTRASCATCAPAASPGARPTKRPRTRSSSRNSGSSEARIEREGNDLPRTRADGHKPPAAG